MKRSHFLYSAVALAILLVVFTGSNVQLSAHAKASASGLGPEGILSPEALLGTAFTYQGRLDDGGSPANGLYDLEFKLYDAASGGSQVSSTVTKDNVTVTDGLITLELDFGRGAFNGEARWLEIGVRPGSSTDDYTPLSPRQALTPAPYALGRLLSAYAPAATEGDLATTTSFRDRYLYSKNLDEDPTAAFTDFAQFDMFGGRLTKVPVTKAWYGRKTVTTGDSDKLYFFRARCAGAEIMGVSEPCDPVMFVRYQVCDPTCADYEVEASDYQVEASDDGYGAPDYLGSRVRTFCPANSTCKNWIVVASKTRHVMKVYIEWADNLDFTSDGMERWVFDTDTPSGLDMDSMGATGDSFEPVPVKVGGTVVKLGPLPTGTTLAVHTPNDGQTSGGASNETHTRMWLFNESNLYRSSYQTVCGSCWMGCDEESNTCEMDPKIGITDDGWSKSTENSDNFLVIGKSTSGPDWKTTETFVELTRTDRSGDFNASYSAYFTGGSCIGYSTARVPCTGNSRRGGTGADDVLPGRYYFVVEANMQHEADGEFGAGLFADMLNGGADDSKCPPSGHYRGRGNNLAFTMHIQVSPDNSTWETYATRHVPRALVSPGPKDRFHDRYARVMMEVDVQPTYYYRVILENNSAQTRSYYYMIRNADVAEFKIAHVNLEYEEAQDDNPNSARNVTELLSSSGHYYSERVIEQEDKRWEWDADYVQFNEVQAEDDHETVERIQVAISDSSRYPHNWQTVVGNGKEMSNGCWWTPDDRFNLSFANEWVTSGANPNFAESALHAVPDGKCDIHNPDYSVDTTSACIVKHILPSGVCRTHKDWFTVPNTLNVRKLGQSPVPVAVFNTYFPHGNSDGAFSRRYDAVSALINRITSLLIEEPSYFNTTNTPWVTADNRIIIMGDLNAQNNDCGEFAEYVRRLRHQFGYAVDVSSVQLDLRNRTLDMHYSGVPIDEMTEPSAYYECDTPDEGIEVDQESDTECTKGFKQQSKWVDDDDSPDIAKYANGTEQHYPWWASTDSGDGKGNRLDVILLVGLGWRLDDPVVKYMPLSSIDYRSYANGYQDQGGGVEIGDSDEDDHGCESPDYVASDTTNYMPRNANCGEQFYGSRAFNSDHKPIGARLRIASIPTPPPPRPTCTDGVKNGDETGIDCGGSCTGTCLPPVTPNHTIYLPVILH